MKITERKYPLHIALSLLLGVGMAQAAHSSDAQIIHLTQTPCQFVESEDNIDQGFTSTASEDCQAINKDSAEQRLANSNTLSLPAGKYVFRVSNKNVPYDLGFWLRGKGIIGYASLPSVSGGGLSPGTSRDYAIDLEPGEYLYSCPLNPTPDYTLVVTE